MARAETGRLGEIRRKSALSHEAYLMCLEEICVENDMTPQKATELALKLTLYSYSQEMCSRDDIAASIGTRGPAYADANERVKVLKIILYEAKYGQNMKMKNFIAGEAGSFNNIPEEGEPNTSLILLRVATIVPENGDPQKIPPLPWDDQKIIDSSQLPGPHSRFE